MSTRRGNRRTPSGVSHEDAAPGGGSGPNEPDTQLLPGEEEIVFNDGDDLAAPVGDDSNNTGNDGEDEDADEAEVGDDTSQGSSTYSLTAERPDLTNYIDLTDPDGLCLVKMGRKVDGRVISCVCGKPRATCGRSTHQDKQTVDGGSLRGPPGFYSAIFHRGSTTQGDGRLDHPSYSAEEVQAFREATEREREEVTQHFSPSNSPTDEGAPSRDPTVQWGSTSEAPPPEVDEHPSGEPDVMEGPTVPPQVPADPSGGWFCVTQPSGQRVATNSPSKVMEWQSLGGKLTKLVPTRKDAHQWIQEWVPPIAAPQGPLFGNPPDGPARGVPPTPMRRQDPQIIPVDDDSPPNGPSRYSDPFGKILTMIGKVPPGPDVSTGTTLIFGEDPADTLGMDKLLLPPHLEDGETRSEFYDLAMDVANLPGGYRLTDDDDFGSTELLARAFGRQRNTFYRSWRKSTHNSIARVASKKELLQFVHDVEKTVTRQKKSQDHRMRDYLLSCRVPTEVVTMYLHSGPLPRLINDTFRFYLGLLETLRSACWEMDTSTWKDGYVDQMIRHHASELGQIRETASNYRMHLLETYVYLRNAHKEKYQDPSFTRSLLYSVAKSRTDPTEPSKVVLSPTPLSTGPKRCPHCRRAGIHSGDKKEDCPLACLPAKRAQSALSGLNKAQCKAVSKTIKDSFTANPSGNAEEIIASARAEV